MKGTGKRAIASFLLSLALILPARTSAVVAIAPPIPDPVLYFRGQEFFESGGKRFARYQYDVLNKSDYPDELFAASPDLPPCGTNISAARTWVDIYDQRGKRLNGFCALNKPATLSELWFSLEADVVPPSYIYIEMTDRKTNTKYKSNLADTVL